MLPLSLTVFTLLTAVAPAWSQQIADATSLASIYSLSTSTSLPFPTQTLSNTDAQQFLVSGWSLSRGKIEQGGGNIAFVNDPFPDKPAPTSTQNITGPVMQVKYPKGAFGSETSGAQMYSLWNTSDGSAFQSMLLSYEVAFDADFDFVKGGKLPGLRGGPDPDGCSGGAAANGTNCFSTRIMWRKSAVGEVYAYIPTPNNICSNSNFRCNSDGFGTSIDRGSFAFVPGQWNRVTLLVRLNEPTNIVNGEVTLYYNNVRALDEQALQYRSADSIDIGGLYFSTFFGGGDSSWAPPADVNAYFRNFQMWGSAAPSNLSGSQANGVPSLRPHAIAASVWSVAALALSGAVLGALL